MNGSQWSPALSVVVTARNDNHGGNLLHRMQLFLDGLGHQCAQHRLPAELIMVEWNPPQDQPPLSKVLTWPKNGWCTTRTIKVPQSIHSRLECSDRLPLFQMIAKNVGIRRARGRFVLATNVDLLFSDELMVFLASKKLDTSRFYRIDRYDVPSNIPLNGSMEEKLQFCRDHILRINRRAATYDSEKGTLVRIYSPRRRLLHKFDRMFSRFLPQPLREWFWRAEHLLYGAERKPLHTNAAGDFTLMARERWNDLRGYPELQLFSMHLDALLCYAAHHSGMRERVLKSPKRIYHLEHSMGWSPDVLTGVLTDDRLDVDIVPQVSQEQMNAWAVQMRREKRPLIFNDEDWGLAGDVLEEVELDEGSVAR